MTQKRRKELVFDCPPVIDERLGIHNERTGNWQTQQHLATTREIVLSVLAWLVVSGVAIWILGLLTGPHN